MAKTCTGCSAELVDGSTHFCARTKEPKARELEARIKSLGRAFDVLQKDGQDDRDRIEALEKQSRDMTMLRSVDHARLEALERAKENTEHGGGGHGAVEDASASACEESTRPAASALPMPERPVDLDEPWRLEHFEPSASDSPDVYRDNFETAEEYRLYALSLESRLAESNKHRNEYAESNLRTASKLADMSEAFARERTDHAALKAKLAECEGPNGLEAIRSTLSKCWSALGITGVVPDPIWALVKKQREEADWLRPQVRTLTADRDALRAKLDGVREALSDAIGTVGGARRSCVGDHYIHSPQVRLDQVDRWRSALAAAENTNTGTVGADCVTAQVGTQPKQPRHTTSQSSRPLTEPDAVGDSSRHGSEPAVPVPSSATAFEMTPEQRRKLLDSSLTGTDEDLMQFVRSLVRSELRKAREGWVTREVAERALEQCALEYISGSSVHANAKDYLTAAIRAASKEASDGTR